MITRRGVLGGLAAMTTWGDPGQRPEGMVGRGGNPPMRPDQAAAMRALSSAGSGPAPQNVDIVAQRVIVGGLPNQQVIIDSTLSLTVTTHMVTGGLPASDITSITMIKAAIRFPSNNAAETSPPLVAETLITFTDATVADALLILSGFTGVAGNPSAFTLMVSASSTGSKLGSVISGTYTFAGSTITLTPLMFTTNTGALVFYEPSGGPVVAALGDTKLMPAAETWHSLGALGAHYTVTRGRYRLTAEGLLRLSVEVVGDGLQATTVAFANTLPLAYRPNTDHTALPMGTTRQVTAGDIWPRLTVTAAGAVNVINQGTANTFAFSGSIPIDD